jgi:GR25 family glycosyltransferase involved in LPS biosynthesis
MAENANVNISRFDAIYGKELESNHPDILKYFVNNHKLIDGQIGCALSHIKIWQDAIKNNYENIIIFEDDAIIPEDFWRKFNNAYNELPKDWDMLLLGCCTCTGNTTNNTNLIKANSKGNWCTTSYLININYLKKLIERINKKKISVGIDNYLRKDYHNDSIYIPSPPFILQNKTVKSDIIIGELGNTLQIDNKRSISWG